jgi:hypothetical protein
MLLPMKEDGGDDESRGLLALSRFLELNLNALILEPNAPIVLETLDPALMDQVAHCGIVCGPPDKRNEPLKFE